VFSLHSAEDYLKRMADWAYKQWRVRSVESTNLFSGEWRRRRPEESKLKFMCCKIVKRLTVSLPGEYSNKPSVKFRTHKLFVVLPGNMQQYGKYDGIW
jgi:hypothetical protein